MKREEAQVFLLTCNLSSQKIRKNDEEVADMIQYQNK
jgi:hypothetical protein